MQGRVILAEVKEFRDILYTNQRPMHWCLEVQWTRRLRKDHLQRSCVISWHWTTLVTCSELLTKLRKRMSPKVIKSWSTSGIRKVQKWVERLGISVSEELKSLGWSVQRRSTGRKPGRVKLLSDCYFTFSILLVLTAGKTGLHNCTLCQHSCTNQYMNMYTK